MRMPLLCCRGRQGKVLRSISFLKLAAGIFERRAAKEANPTSAMHMSENAKKCLETFEKTGPCGPSLFRVPHARIVLRDARAAGWHPR